MLGELDVYQRLVLVRYSVLDSQTLHAQQLFVFVDSVLGVLAAVFVFGDSVLGVLAAVFVFGDSVLGVLAAVFVFGDSVLGVLATVFLLMHLLYL